MGSPPLKVLLAGVDRDERWPIEAAVRRALAQRASEQWSVSLVRVGAQWLVTLEGPATGQRSFSVETDGLEAAIRAAVGVGSPPASEAGTALPTAADPMSSGALRTESRVEAECRECGLRFAVVYEARPEEPTVSASVACPHCWQIDRVEIGEWAASGHDYRAVKA